MSLRLPGERNPVDAHPRSLHRRQHGDERTLQIAIHLIEPLGDQHGRQSIGELQGEIRTLPRVVQGGLGARLPKPHRLRAAAADVFLGERLVAEMLERRGLERVVGPGGVEQIARQHGVEAKAFEPNAVPREHDDVELQVVPDLLYRGILEDGPQYPQHLLRVRPGSSRLRRWRGSQEAVLDAGWPMPDRDVPRRPGPRGKCQSDDAGSNRGGTVRQHAQPKAARRAEFTCQRLELVRPRHQAVVFAGRFRGWRELHDNRAEPELRKQLVTGFSGRSAVAERADIEVDRDVGVDAKQLAAAPGVRRVSQQRLAILFLRDLGGSLEQRVERAVAGDQIARTLLPDAGHSLDVVDGVAHQRQDVDHLIGPDAELLLDAGRVVPRPFFARVEDPDRRRPRADRNPCRR